MLSALAICGTVIAHPGHGTPIEEPSDPGTGSANTGGSSSGASSANTDSSSTGSSNTGSSGHSGSSQSSSSSGSASNNPGSTSGGQSDQPVAGSQADSSDNTGLSGYQGTSTGSVDIYGSASNVSGGPVAMIGLIVVVGLIAMYFPYKKGGTLSKLQMRLFGTEN